MRKLLIPTLAIASILSFAAPAAISFVATSAFAQALSVEGPAGAVVTVQYVGCAYVAHNSGGARVRVHLGAWSALVNPGQDFRFTGFGGCFQTFVGKVTAEYA
jgi:hypothetical protein